MMIIASCYQRDRDMHGSKTSTLEKLGPQIPHRPTVKVWRPVQYSQFSCELAIEKRRVGSGETLLFPWKASTALQSRSTHGEFVLVSKGEPALEIFFGT